MRPGQVRLFYRAQLLGTEFNPGHETNKASLFRGRKSLRRDAFCIVKASGTAPRTDGPSVGFDSPAFAF